ncbi:ABR044Cp [Eremothecium gossypii ATCC 10895]|uniref:ABR044Cp n=1 Tax=Eremothecium gossypii (strain ATCC 10895 / CBS 109.51 / FGSC 9923 / NRRL Y-1056) TaxID=284811 RepID=Q75DI1_EREGS|nr:ABR044Cp [Eremothecium gossypii ATCC 10895]AAS50814.2 ABR044Cp [Eremothecium gossypii ATCC 10895]AEY95103.1 FABR044Cp [Eremothecium gossypii FDAG1]
MYSKEDWGGKIEPYIEVNMQKLEGKALVAVFNFQDFRHLGYQDHGELRMVCTQEAVNAQRCTAEELGQLLVRKKVYNPETGQNETLRSEVKSMRVEKEGVLEPRYPVKETGFYCVFVYAPDVKYAGEVTFQNAFGHLPASDVNNLMLYGLLAVAYAIAMALYMFAVWKHKHELLLLQKYILAFFLFLTLETILVWSAYDLVNRKGVTAGTITYNVFISIINAGKVSMSCFLILIVALGYGVVYPKLNRKLMRRVQVFTAFNFVTMAAAIIHSSLTRAENVGVSLLLSVFPVLTLIVFYVLIIRSLGSTLGYLREHKQVVKLNAYRKMFMLIIGSIVLNILGVFFSIFSMARRNDDEIISNLWKTKFIMEVWPSFVYFLVFVVFAFMWRPTDTSYMLACSQQLPTDPENVTDFDLDDLQSLNDDASNRRVNDDEINFSDEEGPGSYHPSHQGK